MNNEEWKCCFTCKHQSIHETSHEWVECHCKIDGRWHNPYRPTNKNECENWEKNENDKR